MTRATRGTISATSRDTSTLCVMAICKISVADSPRVSQSCNEIGAADCPLGASLLAMSYSAPTWVRVYTLGLVLALIAITVGCIVAAAGATPNERGVWVAQSILFGSAALGMAILTIAIERKLRRRASGASQAPSDDERDR